MDVDTSSYAVLCLTVRTTADSYIAAPVSICNLAYSEHRTAEETRISAGRDTARACALLLSVSQTPIELDSIKIK
jgi:hypothetical protein